MPLIKINRRRTLLFSALTAVAGLLSISACSTEENPPAGTLTLTTAPTSINVVPGGTGNATATITRGGSFAGPVTLSATGASPGVTATFNPAQIAASSSTATINVAVDAGVATGNKTITINAAGSGVTTATATLTVVVVSAANGAIALTATPVDLPVAMGAAAVTSAIAITRTAPFAGPVALTVTGAPAYVNATLNPTSAPGAASTLSVQATAGVVNGTYPLVVHGTGTGVADATTTVNVTVTGGSAQGIAFTFNPASLPITAGGASGNSTVTIARNGGFTGSVNLALTGQPAGMTATVTPSSNVSGSTATVTAQATGAVTAGTYNLTLTGTGSGIPPATGTLPVVVSGGGGGGNASVTFCAEDAPLWVAAQDGNNAWTRVTGTGTGGLTYQFSFSSGKGGVAYVQDVGAGTDLSVIYASAADFNTLGGSSFSGCGTKTVNGTVANVAATERASIALGFSFASTFTGNPLPPAFPAFTLTDVADGSLDLIATRTDLAAFNANKVILRRGLNVSNGGSLALLDFNAAEAFVPVTANVTLSGLGADEAIISSSYAGVYGSGLFGGTVGFIPSYTGTAAVPYTALPAAQLTNALELQQLTAAAPSASNEDASRTAGIFFHSPANRTVTMGPVIATPTVTKVVTAPYARPRVVLTGQAEYNRLFSADYSQSTIDRSASVFATAGYFGTAPASWDLTLPDLSTVNGWSSDWGLLDGTPIDWTVIVQGGVVQFLDANTIVDGSTFQTAFLSSGTTPLNLRAMRGATDPGALQARLVNALRGLSRNPLR